MYSLAYQKKTTLLPLTDFLPFCMFHVDLFPSHSYRLFEGHSLSGLCNKTNEPIAWEWMQLKWNWKRLQFFLVGQHVIFYDFHLLFSSPFPLLFVCLCVVFLSFFLTVIKSKKDTVKKARLSQEQHERLKRLYRM